MEVSIEQLLNELEKPENADQIKNLANFKCVEHAERAKEVGGLTGRFVNFVMKFAQNHMVAIKALSECENIADIKEFRKTEHYEKIKNITVGAEQFVSST